MASAMPSRFSSDGSLRRRRRPRRERSASTSTTIPIERHRSRPTWPCSRRTSPASPGRRHRGEPPGAHPRQHPDGALQQVRLAGADHRQQERDGRRLLHALRRHGRRLRRDQGRAQDAGLRAVAATATAQRPRSSRERVITKPPIAELRPDQTRHGLAAALRGARPDPAGLRRGGRAPSTRSSPLGFDEATVRAGRPPGRPQRVQAPPGRPRRARSPRRAFGKDRRLPITNRYRKGRGR